MATAGAAGPSASVNVSLPTSRYSSGRQEAAFFDAVLQRVSALPGVRSAAVSSAVPPMKKRMTPLLPEGQPQVPLSERPVITIEMVSPGWFQTMRVPLHAGRGFSDADTPKSPSVVIVNEAFARRFWANETAIGKRVEVGRQAASEIIGVAGDVRNNGLGADPAPQLYLPFAQAPWSNMNLLVRTAGEPRVVLNAVRQQVFAVDPEQPVSAIATAEELLASARSDMRFTTLLLGGFATLALALALVGLYGVLAYSVAQRRRELAIRVALGATSQSVMHLVFRHGAALVGIGIAAGIVGSLAVSRLMESMLYKVSSVDPTAFLSAIVLFPLAAAVAMYLPARRAVRLDMLEDLR